MGLEKAYGRVVREVLWNLWCGKAVIEGTKAFYREASACGKVDREFIDEPRGFRKRKGCLDQIFAVKKLVEEYLGKYDKLYVAFMDLKKVVVPSL